MHSRFIWRPESVPSSPTKTLKVLRGWLIHWWELPFSKQKWNKQMKTFQELVSHNLGNEKEKSLLVKATLQSSLMHVNTWSWALHLFSSRDCVSLEKKENPISSNNFIWDGQTAGRGNWGVGYSSRLSFRWSYSETKQLWLLFFFAINRQLKHRNLRLFSSRS